MTKPIHRVLPVATLALAACAGGDGVDEDATAFDGIAPSEVITLSGTEPFWSIELEPGEADQYSARLSTPDDIQGTTYQVTRFAGNNGLGFSGTRNGEDMQIAISPGGCSDGMSDRTYPFSAIVAINETTLQGCAYSSDNPFSEAQRP